VNERVKTHRCKHRVAYISGAVGLFVGASVATILITRRADASVQVNPRGIFIKSPIITQTILERRGHPGNHVMCVETGEVFASQSRAADVMQVGKGTLSKHLKGTLSHAGGYTFEKLGEAS